MAGSATLTADPTRNDVPLANMVVISIHRPADVPSVYAGIGISGESVFAALKLESSLHR
jgi:hypothetical protein